MLSTSHPDLALTGHLAERWYDLDRGHLAREYGQGVKEKLAGHSASAVIGVAGDISCVASVIRDPTLERAPYSPGCAVAIFVAH